MVSPAPPMCDTVVFTIPSGSALSGIVNVGNRVPVSLFVPSAWTAADITMQTSLDGGATWFGVYTAAGDELTIPGVVGGCVAVPFIETLGVGTVLRLRSGSAAAPVNQGAERVVQLRAAQPDT